MFSRNKQPPIKSLIAEGSRIDGNVHFTDGLRIDGVVVGDVRAGDDKPGLLVISATARVEGLVQAAHVIVNGQINGPVHASTMLELQPKARIAGDVHYKTLEMHQGATISGKMFPADVLLEEKPTLKLASSNP
ncbi:bactofilin family protein [Simplicispira lacusdiani]|uniref:bactofilin family protein n=1 Tax=Simplicispira lacusdiani TaxID=2213010 RepID=UPI000E720EAE|nr:polymer-forming cytoskeletal protein [Simplicispira lacusdiani]